METIKNPGYSKKYMYINIKSPPRTPLSPNLFNSVVEEIFRNINWDR